jgi:hypothetical protein
MYKAISEGMDFSTEFDTYIIAYTPDSNDWFITNNRFFPYEYPKEFKTKEEAFEYFKNNFKEFYDIEKNILGDEWEYLPVDFKRCVYLNVSEEKYNRFPCFAYARFWKFYLTGTIELTERWW